MDDFFHDCLSIFQNCILILIVDASINLCLLHYVTFRGNIEVRKLSQEIHSQFLPQILYTVKASILAISQCTQ